MKSSFHVTHDVNGDLIIFLTHIYNIKVIPLRNRLKYLGFNLKTVGYRVADWSWIADRFYKKIDAWEYKCLSIGGSGDSDSSCSRANNGILGTPFLYPFNYH